MKYLAVWNLSPGAGGEVGAKAFDSELEAQIYLERSGWGNMVVAQILTMYQSKKVLERVREFKQ